MNYSTAILKVPAGWYQLCGSVPVELAESRWDTEQEAIDALISIGVERFQLNNCTWYEVAK